ncbi:MAG: hypothetical protein J6N70_03545 [Oribacterium sp.]|nr:hypothetical protein [Oribacterium sp.]MBQ5330744.1 hypothetical protein [Oscillospiraceae bacterium]
MEKKKEPMIAKDDYFSKGRPFIVIASVLFAVNLLNAFMVSPATPCLVIIMLTIGINGERDEKEKRLVIIYAVIAAAAALICFVLKNILHLYTI